MGVKSYNIDKDNADWLTKMGAAQDRSASWYLNDLLTRCRAKVDGSKPKAPAVKNGQEIEYPDQLNVTAWEEWKKYRREMKMKAYKPTPRSEGAAVNKLIEMSGGDHQVQALIIKQSMENSWQGLFELRGNHAADKPTANAAGNRKLSAAEENEERLRQLYGNGSVEGYAASGSGVHSSSHDGHLQQPVETHEATIELGADDWRTVSR